MKLPLLAAAAGPPPASRPPRGRPARGPPADGAPLLVPRHPVGSAPRVPLGAALLTAKGSQLFATI